MFRKKAAEAPPPPPQDDLPSVASLAVDGVNDPKDDAGLGGKMATGKRRFVQKMRGGTAKSGSDADFEERSERVMVLKDKVAKVKDSMKAQQDAARAFCGTCAQLGSACADADVRDIQFQNMQYQLDEGVRTTLEEDVVKALESLEKKLAQFDVLKKKIVTRQNLKLDYDHYVRKVKDLAADPKHDPSKLTNNESKLEASRQRLIEATAGVYMAFNYYDAIGGRLVQSEVEVFKRAQLNFFQTTYNIVKDITLNDPKQVAEDVERIGKEGMARRVDITLDSNSGAAGSGDYTPRSPSPEANRGRGSMSDEPWRQNGGSGAAADVSESPPVRSSFSGSSQSASVDAAPAAWMSNAGGGGGGSSGGSWWDQNSVGNNVGGAPATSAPAAPGGSAQLNPFGGPKASPPPPPAAAAQRKRAKALYAYAAEDPSNLSLAAGDVITVIAEDESGWWTGEKNGQRGLFPSNYVQVM